MSYASFQAMPTPNKLQRPVGKFLGGGAWNTVIFVSNEVKNQQNQFLKINEKAHTFGGSSWSDGHGEVSSVAKQSTAFLTI